ncbi:AMP-binding protein [Cellvibrio sp. NN19]|uniref:AMP-binding protein n=1 Tax=Cellvibrio chitinivorans TaxID=3102792 RepID=UPI002B416FF2|nr:AMP-binding protein [Cellvibrio sp. NN19]
MNKILSAIYQHAQATPQKIALTSETVQLSYAELVAKIDLLANWLIEQNIHNLGLWGENSSEWIIADLAAWQANITLVPLPRFFSNTQLQHVIAQAQLSSLLVCGDINSVAQTSERKASPIANIYLDQLANTIAQNKNATEKNDASEALASVAKITFTSGTTGTPKGVLLSTNALENVTCALADRIYSATNAEQELNTHLNLLPLSTLLENIAGVYVPLYLGKRIVAVPGATLGLMGSSQLSLPTLLQALHHYQPNSLIVLPQILQGFVAASAQGFALPASLKFIAVGGARTPVTLIEQARTMGIAVYEGYGLSECASVVSLNAPGAEKIGSVGRALNHVEIKIDAGIIKVRGNVFSGYLGQSTTQDEWLDTGDMGYIDDEGFIFITGRKKNLLISSYGRNISPEWIESELSLCRSIAQVMVIGDSQPFCSAIIVPASAQITAEHIMQDIRTINQRLPDYARVQKFIVAAEAFTPANQLLTDNGRLRRAAILGQYLGAIAAIYSDSSTHACHTSPQHAGVVYDIF